MADQSAWQNPSQEAVRLGGYRVLAELARGGMAAVFLAMREPRQHPSPPELSSLVAAARYEEDAVAIARVVEDARDIAAIKQIHAHLAHDPDFVAMLMDEARIATRISHPNVVEIREYRLGDADGTNFIAMEYVAGESLSTIMRAAGNRNVRVPPVIAASVGADVAGALHTAHELRGPTGEALELVHRDVSPQNVLIRYDGRVKLTDFGVAKAVGRLQRTQPGEIKGKLAYMAPEQAYGRAVDRRSDVYSLGVVLFELALGRRLFGGRSDAETVRNIMQHNIPRPTAVDPTFPAPLEEIILGMLQADPSQRFQSAGAVERALRAFVASSGAQGIDAHLGELARSLEPQRYRAKTELVLRELLSTAAPAVPRGDDDHGSRTLLASSQRPVRVATQAAPKATGQPAATQPLDASEARTIPLAAQARMAIAAVGGAALDQTRPVARPDHAPTTMHDATSPEFTNPTHGQNPLLTGDDVTRQTANPSLRPPPPSSLPPQAPPQPSSLPPPPMAPNEGRIDQTMLSGVPQQVYEQIAQAAHQSQRPVQPQGQAPHQGHASHQGPPSHQGHASLQGQPSMPPRPFQAPPSEKKSNAVLWALVAVGMVLFVLAALFVLSRLH